MYKHTLRVNGEYLAKEQALPANINVLGNGGALKAGSMLGAVEVVIAAAEPVTLPQDSRLTLTLEGSDDGSTFKVLPVSYALVAKTGGESFAKGDELGRLPIASSAPKQVRCRIATDNSGVQGKVDVFYDFLPR